MIREMTVHWRNNLFYPRINKTLHTWRQLQRRQLLLRRALLGQLLRVWSYGCWLCQAQKLLQLLVSTETDYGCVCLRHQNEERPTMQCVSCSKKL